MGYMVDTGMPAWGNIVYRVPTQCMHPVQRRFYYANNHPNPRFALFAQVVGFLEWKMSIILMASI